ncbi:hypothetical protein ECBCE034MS14_4291 [Escherichia coli BCE034_MS-14]|nr:hypothetical protein ECBCE034MS14_4291 [Escherichia coli BCE034_MS-14]
MARLLTIVFFLYFCECSYCKTISERVRFGRQSNIMGTNISQ